jgi:hypothetical protein
MYWVFGLILFVINFDSLNGFVARPAPTLHITEQQSTAQKYVEMQTHVHELSWIRIRDFTVT